ncbi:hypothetical protein F511_14888 [Dorcoceras hygrometricum]|uniref:Uncharacterized protein n=1 Tax=Dorcoceras hygrometricum TaxID=472368 RepID=A0A2Z7C058_9LAMI|nr:hypothetical protein F511_14888 [Dorcoceras hygrometricum]
MKRRRFQQDIEAGSIEQFYAINEYAMRMSACTENSKENTLRFVNGSSELNLIRLLFFRNGKDPIEDFDYNDPRFNPLLRPTATRTPSHTTAHQPASYV